jgi:Fe-S cluster assembly ATP-binding protein
MLRIEDLKVEIEGRVVLDGIDLEVPEGKTHVLFGPNGSGKTSLLMTIMGFEAYKVLEGRIYFRGQDITNLPIHERAKLGIGMSFQRPPSVDGLKLSELIHLIGCEEEKVGEIASEIKFESFLDRDVNVGFSGGEIKRSELLQLMAQQPDLLLFDEPESGVDLESIVLIGRTISNLIKGRDGGAARSCLKRERETRTRSGLIITHTGYILDYVDADEGHVLYNGRIACRANARELLREISANGYGECLRCLIQ